MSTALSGVSLSQVADEFLHYIDPHVRGEFLHLQLYDPAFSTYRSLLLKPCCLETGPDGLKTLLDQYRIQNCRSVSLLIDGHQVGTLTMGDSCAGPGADELPPTAVLGDVGTHFLALLERLAAAAKTRESRIEAAAACKSLATMQEIADAVASHDSPDYLLAGLSRLIAQTCGAQYLDLLVYDPMHEMMRRSAVHFITRDRTSAELTGKTHRLDETTGVVAFQRRECLLTNQWQMQEMVGHFDVVSRFWQEGLREFCSVPLIVQGASIGTLNIGNAQCGAFSRDSIEFLNAVGKLIASTVKLLDMQQKQRAGEIRVAAPPPAPSLYYAEEAGIIGESKALRSVLEQVRLVADTPALVLILGETGTGKELVARAVHALSPRRDHPLIKVNCAALPSGILESELFGYQKGAFTGAVSSKLGLVEAASHGTIFLDEVGDLPLELQPKLLRFLQEKEFCRLGSTQTQRADVRVIAATNCDLAEKVKQGEFRSDLFYRLNVFPVRIPSLRERCEDIPRLVWHFVRKYSTLMHRQIDTVPEDVMQRLANAPWLGNIRELENLIERSVILSRGPVLTLQNDYWQDAMFPAEAAALSRPAAPPIPVNPDEISAEMIQRVLIETNGIVGGPRGAAQRLGIKRTTLLWRMRRYGIDPKQLLNGIQ
ncbi:MAG: sigma 54-interacting transcriptional regulator [Acidobacteriota bacterium]|nr:sigma 54-interacting transcriptional regulator [Acidobacteriota bacterium]